MELFGTHNGMRCLVTTLEHSLLLLLGGDVRNWSTFCDTTFSDPTPQGIVIVVFLVVFV